MRGRGRVKLRPLRRRSRGERAPVKLRALACGRALANPLPTQSTALTMYQALAMTSWLPQTEAALAQVGGAGAPGKGGV